MGGTRVKIHVNHQEPSEFQADRQTDIHIWMDVVDKKISISHKKKVDVSDGQSSTTAMNSITHDAKLKTTIMEHKETMKQQDYMINVLRAHVRQYHLTLFKFQSLVKVALHQDNQLCAIANNNIERGGAGERRDQG